VCAVVGATGRSVARTATVSVTIGFDFYFSNLYCSTLLRTDENHVCRQLDDRNIDNIDNFIIKLK